VRTGPVAEGIERPAQLGALRALGCRRGQGYLLGRPTPPGEVDLSCRHFAHHVPAQRSAEARTLDTG
jgi:EAL domain-containing protein (putative c-di-GMP-specific phosphodiesterase class I)